MVKKFAEFEQNFRTAIESIKKHQMDESYGKLATWMLETTENPYSYLPQVWASAVESAESLNQLLNVIQHAVHDDGDIAFVKVYGVPRIVFADKHDMGFQEKVLSTLIAGRPNREITVEILDINPNDFGVLYNEYQVQFLKQCFVRDAGRFGVEFANTSYSHHKLFSVDWAETCKSDIEFRSNFHNKKIDN